jgi:hypothetical protein
MFHGWNASGLPFEARERGHHAGWEHDRTSATFWLRSESAAQAANAPLSSRPPRKLSNIVNQGRKKSKPNKQQNRNHRNNHVLIVSG